MTEQQEEASKIADALGGAAERLTALQTVAKHGFGMVESQATRLMLERILRDLIAVDNDLRRNGMNGNPLVLIRVDESRVWD